MKARTLLAPVASFAISAAGFLSAPSAFAVEPAQVHEGASVAGLLGFGANEYGFNFGVRGGYTLPNHVYLGGTIIGNTGLGDTQLAGWGLGFTTGFEGGYEIAAGPIVVRPYGGIGFTSQTFNGYFGGMYNPTLCAEGQLAYCGTGTTPNPNYNPTLCEEGVTQDCSATLNGNLATAGTSTNSLALWVGGTVLYDFKGGPWFVSGDFRFGDAPALFYQQALFAVMAGGGYEF
jgi:hypothetical protein